MREKLIIRRSIICDLISKGHSNREFEVVLKQLSLLRMTRSSLPQGNENTEFIPQLRTSLSNESETVQIDDVKAFSSGTGKVIAASHVSIVVSRRQIPKVSHKLKLFLLNNNENEPKVYREISSYLRFR